MLLAVPIELAQLHFPFATLLFLPILNGLQVQTTARLLSNYGYI